MIKVLQDWQEIGEATLELQRQGLPMHTDIRKNWDHFLLYNAISSQDRNSCFVDLGCTPYCTVDFLGCLNFKKIYGIDLNVEDYEIMNSPYTLCKGDITKTTFQDNFFDFAISLSVIEHGVDLNAFFEEVSRILKINGRLFLTTDYWEEKINISKSIKPLDLPWKVFSKEEIEKLISIAQNHGFSIENVGTGINIPSCSKKNVIWQGIEYTFIALLLKKEFQTPTAVERPLIEYVTEDKKYIKNPEGVSQTRELLDRVRFCADRYTQNPFEDSVLTDLRLLQREVAEWWLNLEEEDLEKAYWSNLGEAHRLLLDCGLKNELLPASERMFVEGLIANLSQGISVPKFFHNLLGAMLYAHADKLPLTCDLLFIPQWLINDYLIFIFVSPPQFKEVGEAESYYQHIDRWVDYLYTNILNNQDSSFWQYISLFFVQKTNLVPLYFNSQNLKNIYKKRADIMEFFLKNQEHQINYDFARRSPKHKKIRLGILAAHFQPQTETFATLPVYKHLNRDLFEIILYAVYVGEHRLERYCWGHADSMIVLPQDLESQVQTIRDGDLDIILIATNVTAWANPITLLALHRLARIQISNVCSCVTTGMRHVDYYISGKLSEPENGAEMHYTENLVMLEGSAHCYDFATEEQLISTISISREDLRINKDTTVYISGANFYKITPEVLATWTKIVVGTPNSKLVLYPFNPNWSSSYAVAAFQRRLVAAFIEEGLNQAQLIILDSVPNLADVKERLKLGDVYLDSYPFAGATSLLDPLQLGLPTVVLGGTTFRSLVGSALLKELQIQDLIADNEESYIKLAITLGTNSELRQQKSSQIKQKMRDNPGFLDSRSYSAKIETLFQDLFRKQEIKVLETELNLSEINLIVFPNWSQSEELLFLDLTRVINALGNHPDKAQMTLLIDISNVSEEDANLTLSSIMINFFLQENLEMIEDLKVSLIGTLSEIQWEALLLRIYARLVLEHEDKHAISTVRAENTPLCELENLSNKKVIQLKTGAWALQ